MNEIVQRCTTLIEQGGTLSSKIKFSKDNKANYFFGTKYTTEIQSWIASSMNIIVLTTTPNSYYYKESEKIIAHESFTSTIPYHIVQRITGLLESLKNEIELGFFRQLEYIFTASAFDDFLDHAKQFHKSNKITEAAVLASVVFEDTIRKIAKKNGLEEQGNKLVSIIDDLTKQNIFTPVKAKNMKFYSDIRNQAVHSQWDKIDISDVGKLIKGTKELIENYL